MITVYVYCKENGVFLQIDTGSIDCIMNTLEQNKDFTLTPPPNYSQPWHWHNNAWQSEPKPTAE